MLCVSSLVFMAGARLLPLIADIYFEVPVELFLPKLKVLICLLRAFSALLFYPTFILFDFYCLMIILCGMVLQICSIILAKTVSKR